MAALFDRVVGAPLNHFYSGAGLFILGYFKPAAAELEESVRLLGSQGDDSLAHYYLGLAYRESGKREESLKALETFAARSGLDPHDLRVETAKKISAALKRKNQGNFLSDAAQ